MVTAVATDNWMAFTLRYVVDYRARRRAKDALFRRIIEEIDASEAASPSPRPASRWSASRPSSSGSAGPAPGPARPLATCTPAWRRVVPPIDDLLERRIPWFAVGRMTVGTLLAGLVVMALTLGLASLGARAMARVLARRGHGRGVQTTVGKVLKYLVVAIGLGFGLQNVAHDSVSGLILLIEQPIRPGGEPQPAHLGPAHRVRGPVRHRRRVPVGGHHHPVPSAGSARPVLGPARGRPRGMAGRRRECLTRPRRPLVN